MLTVLETSSVIDDLDLTDDDAGTTTAPPTPQSLDALSAEIQRDYRQLVCRVATGEPTPERAALLAVTVPAGKSLAEFQADVAGVNYRIQLREYLAGAQAELRDVHNLIAETRRLGDEIKAAQEAYKARMEPLYQRYEQMDADARGRHSAALQAEVHAKRELEKTADPAIDAELKRIGQEISTADAQANAGQRFRGLAAEKRAKADEYRKALPAVRAGAIRPPVGSNVAEFEQAIATLDRQADEAEAGAKEAAASAERSASLREKSTQLRATKLDPANAKI